MFDQLFQSISTVVGYLVVAVFFIFLGCRPPWCTRRSPECRKRQVQDIPGPLSLPILGTRWVFSFGGYNFGKIHEFYQDMYRKYGAIMKEEALFNVPVISVFEKQDIEKVLKSNSKYPIRPPCEAIAQYRRSKPERYASTGIVNEQGENWHFLRVNLTTDITSPKTISSFLPQVQDIADDWCCLLKQLRNHDCEIPNLEFVVDRLGLETSCALVLGRRMGFLLQEHLSDSARQLANAIHQHFIATRDTYYGLPIWKVFNTSAYKKLAESEETIYTLALKLIHTADEATKESAVFQSVLRANVDERDKTAAIIDFIAAGIHTLKNSLVFLLYLVSKYPDVQKKILEDSTKAYLKACIMETFRLLPTANCLARVTEEDLELSGYRVNAGSVVLCHTGIACRDERNFKDACKFYPERWLNEERSQTASSATFLVTPFGVGRRICPGKRFIEQVLPIILEHTIKNFEIQNVRPMELQFEFLLSPKGPTAMIFKNRY
ncbi:hypothetical protein NQ315_010532 [Exocentrus adspersus]|uniref:Ecdysone 20-monooxygenase n=1 Tax=Exocentrus adspersus TaxID=1586481 RepID=A0AAV8W4M2_9CUCU|nr:hypothetical protein NQ315_010532 [Exocentrus adspersus]